jgi:exopolysaccharide production protein ExoQ
MANRIPVKQKQPLTRAQGIARGISIPQGWVRDNNHWLLLMLFFWLIFYQGLPSSLNGYASNEAFGDPNQTDRIIKISMIAVSCYFIVARWRLARTLGTYLNPGLLGFVILAVLSVLWSIDAHATLMRFISLAAVLLMGFAVALASWHPRRFQQIALPPIMLILLVSLAIGAVNVNLVIEAGQDLAQKNAWHGITHSKNEFGMLSSFATILCANAWMSGNKRGISALTTGVGTVIAAACVLLSRSNTSLLACSTSVLSMALLMRVPVIIHRYTKHLVIAVASMILMYELIIQNVISGLDVLLAPVLGLTGKDATFSARTVIWRVVKEHIQLSPYWGSGYGAYWVGPLPESPSYIFMSVMYIYPTEAHNGYLEVVNDLGYIGLGVLLIFLVSYIRQALSLMQTDRCQAALYLALLFQEMVMDMSESEWFARSNTFAVFALGSICLSRALLDVRLRTTATARPMSTGSVYS